MIIASIVCVHLAVMYINMYLKTALVAHRFGFNGCLSALRVAPDAFRGTAAVFPLLPFVLFIHFNHSAHVRVGDGAGPQRAVILEPFHLHVLLAFSRYQDLPYLGILARARTRVVSTQLDSRVFAIPPGEE